MQTNTPVLTITVGGHLRLFSVNFHQFRGLGKELVFIIIIILIKY